MEPARLFVIGNHEIKPKEDTTQGNPKAMGVYALGTKKQQTTKAKK